MSRVRVFPVYGKKQLEVQTDENANAVERVSSGSAIQRSVSRAEVYEMLVGRKMIYPEPPPDKTASRSYRENMEENEAQ